MSMLSLTSCVISAVTRRQHNGGVNLKGLPGPLLNVHQQHRH